MSEQNFDLYRDIAKRTDGDVYIGVVGPVRTGKSTLISRMMEELVLSRMAAGPRRERLTDELPQSGSGKTIMTTQPKFVPSEAVSVTLDDQSSVRVRMVDSVGYLVEGALGTEEDGASRMVHTPWFDYDIPFEQAAEIGTRKVITDHATIGLVVTTDGSIADLSREAYQQPEERVVRELKEIGKPFILILNSRHPEAEETQALRQRLQRTSTYDQTNPSREDHSTENQMQRFSRHFSEQKPCKDAASGTADEVGECIRDWKAVMQCINHD